jgi:hypothetical protein
MAVNLNATRSQRRASGEGPVPVDSGIAEMVKQGIERARAKLIDLTLRNGMLNYRHSESSSRHVRIVNESARVLVQSLASEESIDVIPLPPVETIPRDEDTEEFRTALKEAKVIDPDWLAAEDARRATGNRRRNKDKAAERALRGRVRAQLGMPEWRAAIDPKVRAQELGINSSYDLSAGDRSKADGGHLKLQTLLFPERLEPKLAAVLGAARSLQEDAGISALYCAVGFLEWYEQEDSPNPAFAPLVLIPINMEKRIANGEYVFSIAGRDEDETGNVALREKLREHNLELPEYDSDVGIDLYLASVAAALRNRPRWRVRRWATIGLFSFSRQAMWSDLDPETWPVGARPEAHGLLRQIYGDAPVGELNAIAAVHDIDQPEVEAQAPVLVTDADASQVSAVIDAAGGASLVIQGPPGTGKSQTITNIIANAMWQGKSILFVSEKMAALNVVKNRLDHMGLGLFCLELHSAKASKALVLQSIRERMNAPRMRSNAQEIERARESLNQARQRLTEYAAVMNSVAGNTGLTTHDVLWGDSSRADLPNSVSPEAMEFRFRDPLAIDRFKLAELKGAGKALDDHAAAMGAFAEPARQPWRGVGNLNLTRFDRANAIDSANHWAMSLEQLQHLVGNLTEICAWPGLTSIREVASAVDLIRAVPAVGLPVEESLLPLMVDDSCVQSLLAWCELVGEARHLEAQIETICAVNQLANHIDRAPQLAQLAADLTVELKPVEALPDIHREAKVKARMLAQAVELIERVFVIAKRDPTLEPDLKAEAIATSFLHQIWQFPADKAHFRLPRLAEDGASEDIAVAQLIGREAAAAAKEAQFSEAATPALAASIPEPQALRQAAATIQNTTFFGRMFGRDWRRAKVTWTSAFPGERKITGSSAARLKAAALWKEGLARLDACAVARDAAGRYWNGPATPFDALLEIAKWMRSVRNVTPLVVDGSRELRRILFEAPSDEIETFIDLAQAAEDLGLISLFRESYSKKVTVHSDAARELQRAEALDTLLQGLNEVGIHPHVAPNALRDAVTAYRQAQECRRKIDLEVMATRALGPVSNESEAGVAAKVKVTLDYIRTIFGTGLPQPVARWLLHQDHSARRVEIAKLAQDMDAAVAEENRTRQRMDELLQLRPDAWCGAPFDEASISRLMQKARAAANAPDDLEKQIALQSTEDEARDLGLGDLLSVWSGKGFRYEGVGWAVEATFYRSCAEKLMRDHPALARHSGNTHEQVRRRFQQLDKEILELNRQLVAAKLHTKTIPVGARAQSTRDYTDNQMLDHQAGLQKPRIALRRLFSNAGNAIRAYKPCIMMSPMSVAQYLEPGKHVFDLLIIDEASQMRPEDSLGAMIRCAQAVIVGDPEQLPPSDFFMAGESREEEEIEDSPEESILELGRRCWRPMRMLEVHYRSRHQSLIAYSNHEFYDDRLLVYPSPVLNDAEFGVTCRNVNGAYETGQGRNPEEAKVVVEEAAALMRRRIDRSIGIVAVNKAQSDLIKSMMDELAASDPVIQAYHQAWDGTLEEFFVKNLENVQGDERDFILESF